MEPALLAVRAIMWPRSAAHFARWADTEKVAILIRAGLFLRIQKEQVGEGRYNPVFRLDAQRYRLLGLTSTRCH
jgi:hypothetical protein